MSRASVGSIGQRRHIALQQLEAIATTTHSFLGPHKRQKFIQDEDGGNAALVSSSARLLENIEMDSSVAQLLNETVQAHQKILRSGTNTLVFLTGIWSRVALDCLHRGFSVSHIKNATTKGLEVCLEACRRSAEILEEMSSKKDSEEKLPKNIKLTLKHSRHFTSNDHQTVKSADVSHVAHGISHGCQDSMNLVLEAYKLQSGCKTSALDIQKLVTCPVSGPSEKHSRVLHGYVVLVSAEQSSVIQHLQEQTLKMALVTGDLSEEYRHVGYNRHAHITHVTDRPDVTWESREERWIETAFKTLRNLSVDVLLVSGVVSVKLKDRCIPYNILVVEGVRTDILKDFSTSTGAVLVSYITQLTERCVGRGVKIRRWREFSRHGGKNDSTAISITAAATSLVTAVITSSIRAELQSLEDRFWSCAHRLHQAFTDGKLLRGAAATELLCIQQLYKSTPGMENPHEKVVMQLMADGWMDYISTLMLNCGTVSCKAEARTSVTRLLRLCEDGEPVCVKALWAPADVDTDSVTSVYDNVTVKFEAWRRALDLVLLVLQSDTEIITGVSEGENVYKEFVFL
ncbi:Bardet-Biedl syndrome 12 protein -like protein [Triplophysa tibetana]|uniref:Bardet-Biedl syndrome 12 protein-like protein n=1 Tax=Triplophysa tibetana TaxID=1572043 RepID=A0A5A9NIG1_9TELE|nr:Bardet-Biedl syndrome 12 protein -like protein [Triplophysa tibetana]